MYRTYRMYSVWATHSWTFLIFIHQNSTRCRGLFGRGKRDKEEKEKPCVCVCVCIGVCDRVIGAPAKWYLFVLCAVTRKEIVCGGSVYALCGFKERQPPEICPLNVLFCTRLAISTSRPFLLIFWHYSMSQDAPKPLYTTQCKKCKHVIHSVECF